MCEARKEQAGCGVQREFTSAALAQRCSQSKAADMAALSDDERALLAQVLRARCDVEEEDMERAIEQVSHTLCRTTHCLRLCLCRWL